MCEIARWRSQLSFHEMLMYQELFDEQERHRFTPGLPGNGFGCCNEGRGQEGFLGIAGEAYGRVNA